MHLRKNIISTLVFLLALSIIISGAFYARITTAQTSFVGSLPPGYASYSGKLVMGKSCSCANTSISGAPALPPLCETAVCFGSSFTRYGFVFTNVEGINSKACDQIRLSTSIPPCFQLDADDAIVISGSMASVQDLSYYGFTLYQSLVYNKNFPDNFASIKSSVGLNLNSANLKIGNNGKYILIFTASTRTLNVLKRGLQSIGVPRAIINHYPIPKTVANLGKIDYPDQLTIQLRLTSQSPEERQQVNTFAQEVAPNTNVIFIKGPKVDGDITFDDIPTWEDTLRSNPIEYQMGLDRQLALLERSVTNTYARQGYSLKARLTEKVLHVDTKECRESASIDCVYDSPDALYSSFPCDFSPSALRNGNCFIQLEQNSDDVLMLLGVDHTLVGDKTLAAYVSAESKKSAGSNDGTFSFMGLYTQGSAKQYWPRNKGDDLYAVKITRDCGDSLYCASVPFLGIPGARRGFFIVGRTYLDKVTASGPNPANLIPAVLLWFSKG